MRGEGSIIAKSKSPINVAAPRGWGADAPMLDLQTERCRRPICLSRNAPFVERVGIGDTGPIFRRMGARICPAVPTQFAYAIPTPPRRTRRLRNNSGEPSTLFRHTLGTRPHRALSYSSTKRPQTTVVCPKTILFGTESTRARLGMPISNFCIQTITTRREEFGRAASGRATLVR